MIIALIILMGGDILMAIIGVGIWAGIGVGTTGVIIIILTDTTVGIIHFASMAIIILGILITVTTTLDTTIIEGVHCPTLMAVVDLDTETQALAVEVF